MTTTKDAIKAHFTGDFTPFFKKYIDGELKPDKKGEIWAACPLHPDKSPSFSFKAADGRFNCFGCGNQGDIFDFYAEKHGLDVKADFPAILSGIALDFGISNGTGTGPRKKPKVVKLYDYQDATGKMIYQVQRWEPGFKDGDKKSFTPRRPDGKGGWIEKNVFPNGFKKVLYRLPEVIKASEVLLVEGEKDADNLAALGFTAATSAGGAGSWEPYYAGYLKGKRVSIIPDQDEAGAGYLEAVGPSLLGVAESVKVVRLPDGIKDASDFLATLPDAESQKDRLSIMIDGAEPFTPASGENQEGVGVRSIVDFIFTAKDFLSLETPPRQTILHPWLKEQMIALLVGPRGIGKSMLCLGILDAVTRGEPFGPWECQTTVPCLFLDGEMTVDDDQERIEMLRLDADRKSPLYFYSDAYATTHGMPKANLNDEKWRDAMKAVLIDLGVKLWIPDNLSSLTPGVDENVKHEWDAVNQWLLSLRFAGITTILPHHTNKDGLQRGTSGREDNIDITLLLKKPGNYMPEDGARFTTVFDKARVKTKFLPLISEKEFQLFEGEAGFNVWTVKDVAIEKKTAILKMLDSGVTQKDIVDTLGVAKSYVSKVKTDAIRDGFLTAKCKFTQEGFCKFSD